jgi:hypothetical protein
MTSKRYEQKTVDILRTSNKMRLLRSARNDILLLSLRKTQRRSNLRSYVRQDHFILLEALNTTLKLVVLSINQKDY